MTKNPRARLQKLAWHWRGVLIAAPIVSLTLIGLRSLGGLQILELVALDQMFVLRGQTSLESQVVIVDITEEDVRKSRRWPLTDEQLLKILQNIKAQKPSAIGLDIYRDLVIEPGHQELVKFMRATPNLFGITKVLGENIKPPLGLKYPDQVGANDLINDPDTKVRRFFLSIPVLEPGNGKNPPQESAIDGFGVKLALKYLSDRQINPEVVDLTKLQYRLGKLSFQPFKNNDGGYARVNDKGYQLILNYQGGRGSFSRITMSEVQENQIPAGFFTGKVVILGASAESLNDLHNTPFSSSIALALWSNIAGTPQRMPGVEIHAQVVSQLIDGAINNRPLITGWSEPQEIIWIFVWSLVGGTLTWVQRHAQQRGGWVVFKIMSMPIAALGLIIFSYGCFQGGIWVPVVPALLALFGSSLSITGYIAKTAGEIRATFGRYITDDVVATLLENPDGAKLGGERRLITILTSDLRGFTALAESLSPEEVVKILNIYLGIMAEVISEYQGTIDEFMGDGILVLFGAPMLREDDPQRAVACAIAMQLAMTRVNQEMQNLGRSDLYMGIGINTGEVVVGNIGSVKRTKYGVVGSQVNLTYRIESYTTAGQILISPATHQAVTCMQANLQIDESKQVTPKGVKEPITIYSVRGIKGKYQLTLPEKILDSLYNLPSSINLHFAILDGKDVSPTAIPATLIKLGHHSAEITSSRILADLTDIKINLVLESEPTLAGEDIYAKVLGQGEKDGNFRIVFTALTPKIELLLSSLYQSCQFELISFVDKVNQA